MIRKARAVWRGERGRAGNGDLSSGSGVLVNFAHSIQFREV